MFGSHPLSKCEGIPMKELLKKVKGETFKNRDVERAEIEKKC
jgi:hypothetical protein